VEVLTDTDELFCCATRVAGYLGVGCDGAEGDCALGLRMAWNCMQTVEVRMTVVRQRGRCCVGERMVVDADTVRLSLRGWLDAKRRD
jgi:hypothetical protein